MRSKATEYAQNPYFEEAMVHWQTIGYKRGQAIVAVGIGNLHLAAGAYDIALGYYRRALQVARETGDPLSEANILFNHGIVASRTGDYTAATNAYHAASAKYAETGFRHGIGTSALALGNVYRSLGDLGTSRRYFEEGIAVLEELGGRSELGDGYTSLGATLFGLGLLDEAERAFQQSLELRRDIGRETIAFVPQVWLARIAAEMGDLELARRRLDQLLADFDPGGISRIYDPGRFYLACYETLVILHDPRSAELLTIAHDLIQQRAAQIADPAMAQAYLYNVPAHRTLIKHYEQRG